MKNHPINWAFYFFLSVGLGACIDMPKATDKIKRGQWRGQFILKAEDKSFVTEGRKKVVTRNPNFEETRVYCPFLFEVFADTQSSGYWVYVTNAQEKVLFGPLSVGKNMRTGSDTFYLDLAPFAACIKGIYEGGKMHGHYIALDRENYAIPFEATYGRQHRFEKIPASTSRDLNGQWHFTFKPDSATSYDGIGIFRQDGHVLKGTIRTETGDYRFLEGTISADRARLSAFDGAHIFLFDMQFTEPDRVEGTFYSGHKYQAHFKASRDSSFALKSGFDRIGMKNTKSAILDFEFFDLDGNKFSIGDPAFSSKNKIIQIMGTWCPNCRDESEFLKEEIFTRLGEHWLVLAIAFERFKEKQKAFEQLKRYRDQLKLPYSIYYGGHAHKDSASAVFHQLTGITAYPSLLILDKQNRLKYSHTGFDGPATPVFDAFRHEFLDRIEKVNKEP